MHSRVFAQHFPSFGRPCRLPHCNDKCTEEKLQPDDERIIPQDDLYTIAWEADFEYELFEPRKDNWPDTATRLVTDATTSEADDYVIENESSSVNESERSSERTNENDVSDNERRPRPASSRDASSPLNESPSGTENENDVTKEINGDENAPKRGAEITVPGISENENSEEKLEP